MAKQQGRKPPKRAPAKPVIDDDLAELAQMLDEQKLDDDINGWFTIPWHDGWNAASLAFHCYTQFEADDQNVLDDDVRHAFGQWTLKRHTSPTIYEMAGDFITHIIGMISRHNLKAARFLLAGLRCTQLTIANSSGGGVTFNHVLRIAFEHVPDHWPALLKPEVRTARCFDAIGVGPMMANDKHDKLRRAFSIAWDRGLYQAAYALPRAT